MPASSHHGSLAGPELLDTTATFVTPEHIAFRFRLVGPLHRSCAWLLDTLFRVLLAALLALLALLVLSPEVAFGLFLLLIFVLDWFAGALCEWLWRGATPGKAILGIRVVGHDGLPADLGACLLRNILRWADGLPLAFVPGLATMATTARFQRLGDLAAGTVVVYTERRMRGRAVPPGKDPAALARARDLPADAVARLDGETLRAISVYVERRKRLAPARREEIARHLAEPLRRRLQLTVPGSADELLCACHLRCFQLDEGATAQAAGVIARRKADWDALEQLLDRPGRDRGGEAVALSRRYRQACADLALAESHHLPDRQVAYLHDLVARSHLAFYRRVTLPLRRLLDDVLIRVPGELAGDACTRIAFLAFFGSFLGCLLLALGNDGLAASWLGEKQVEQYETMYRDPPRSQDGEGATQMTSFYIFNNVSIALACFASGIFAGVGSLLMLIFNGICIGLVFGHMIGLGSAVSDHFLEFVSAHGSFELTGLALSGAAGLRLGLGIAVTGGLPRADALRIAARRAMTIALVAAAFVAAAAPIEAFVSPSDLPLQTKRAVGIVSLVVVVAYLGLLGMNGRRILARRAAQADPLGDEEAVLRSRPGLTA